MLLGTTRTAISFSTDEITLLEGEGISITNKDISFSSANIVNGDWIDITKGNLSRSNDKESINIIRFESIDIPGAEVTTNSEATISTN